MGNNYFCKDDCGCCGCGRTLVGNWDARTAMHTLSAVVFLGAWEGRGGEGRKRVFASGE